MPCGLVFIDIREQITCGLPWFSFKPTPTSHAEQSSFKSWPKQRKVLRNFASSLGANTFWWTGGQAPTTQVFQAHTTLGPHLALPRSGIGQTNELAPCTWASVRKCSQPRARAARNAGDPKLSNGRNSQGYLFIRKRFLLSKKH